VLVLGESVSLYWRVLGAEKVELTGTDGLFQPLTLTTGSLVVAPTGRTSFTLGASNIYGTATPKEVVIAVVMPTSTPFPKPEIKQFDVQPRVINEGENVTIAWDVSSAETVKIIGIPGADRYPPKGTLTQAPLPPGVDYQLIATNGPPGAGAESSVGPFHVTVNPNPLPSGPVTAVFTASPSEITVGDEATLSWNVAGVSRVAIVPLQDQIVFPAIGGVSITPITTTVYTLIASDGKVIVTQPLTVTVKP
jgi:hypothetical protein